MIGIVLIVEGVSSVVLVFENLSKDSFCICWLTIMIDGLTVSLDAHASSMNCVELILDVIRCSRRSGATTSCLGVAISLCNRWSGNLKFSSRSRNQILSLVTAWLEHKTLILFGSWNIILD